MGSQNLIVVQEIRTEWTKKSRGGAEAVQRNAVPEVSRLTQDALTLPVSALLHHAIYYEESAGFLSPVREVIADSELIKPFVLGCVTVGRMLSHAEEPQIYAKFKYSYQFGGAPDRSRMKKTLVIGVGEWGQIIYNGRFSGTSTDWRYQKRVVNIGFFPLPLTSTAIFTSHPPTKQFQATAHLF